MISRIVYVVAVVATGILAQELLPTEQTSFNFPPNGTGIALTFPDTIASLTGLSDWPDVWVTPPFTPNMANLFNPNATSIIGDIVSPPNAVGV
jgi:hypothetical protein